MKISLNWLKQYIDIPSTPEQLSEILTDLGLEVEGMEEKLAIPGGLDGLVVGEVTTCDRHPNADRLSLTTVDIGAEEVLQIVCGAPNVGVGQKVVVATVGTTLYPIEGDPFKIKKGKIRGAVSMGMICAEDEIGIGRDHEGIIVLSDHASVGQSVASFYQLNTDYIYDIGLTPNRSDATSHLGVAKDLAAYYRFHLQQPVQLRYPDTGDVLSTGTGSPLQVTVEDIVACPRFSGISLSNVRVQPSPQWMQDHLRAIDVKPINNIVDITNYVLYEYGQPLHAYDQSKISGQGIIVRSLAEGSAFITLDEKERKLSGEELMICDAHGAGLCIAGVFGGQDSGVTDETTEIFLESAHFNALSVRRTSTYHNLRTDAARCFEKGSDPNITVTALARAVAMMQQYAEAQVSSQLVDIYPQPIVPKEVDIKLSNLNRLIGAQLCAATLERILSALDIDIVRQNGDDYKVRIPTDKSDVTREADVVEEVLRIYGFNNVAVSDRINTAILPIGEIQMPELKRALAHVLVGAGYREMMGLSLIPSRYYEELDAYANGLVYINNTSNIHLDIMRPEMMISGLLSIAHNVNRQQDNLALYELGRTYNALEATYQEEEVLTLWLTGKQEGVAWNTKTAAVDFFALKRSVHRILHRIGLQAYQTDECDDQRLAYGLRYYRGSQNLVQFGKVSAKVQKAVGIDKEIFYAEIFLHPMLKIARKQKIVFEEIPKFPSSRRDLSLVLKEGVNYDQVTRIIGKNAGRILQDITLFDVYKDVTSLGEGVKSYAVRLTFVDKEKNLKDQQVDKVMQKIVHQLEAKIGAKLR